jgi:NDP-4-keto-2,6-dideoxyhexose 3-C-methyltransferase
MYGATYGYRSATSPTMRSHLAAKVRQLGEMVGLRAGDVVLDIGCNDGTLLNAYGDRGLVRIGIDPSSAKFRDHFAPDIRVCTDFFSAERVRAVIGDRKCRIVTSIAMLYDLDDPLDFIRQIDQLLARDGVWGFELSYLPLFLTNLSYDQTCHEHVTYLGMRQIQWLLERTGLEVLDVALNEMNGGSFWVIAGRRGGPHRANRARIEALLQAERPLDGPEPFERFARRVAAHRDEVQEFLRLARAAGKSVYGYGASTKGNVTLNYCGVGRDDLVAICDRQPQKHALVTPGTRFRIVPQDEMRPHADYAFVLIWHLRREVILDELQFLARGGTLVFPLPRLHVVNGDNYERYLDAPLADLGFAL